GDRHQLPALTSHLVEGSLELSERVEPADRDGPVLPGVAGWGGGGEVHGWRLGRRASEPRLASTGWASWILPKRLHHPPRPGHDASPGGYEGTARVKGIARSGTKRPRVNNTARAC